MLNEFSSSQLNLVTSANFTDLLMKQTILSVLYINLKTIVKFQMTRLYKTR